MKRGWRFMKAASFAQALSQSCSSALSGVMMFASKTGVASSAS